MLEGIKVIDLSRLLSGPYATMALADLGAEVIKVESPLGDDTRHLGPPFVNDYSSYFLSVNRNKKSISINLKTKKGKEILLQLIEDADVVIENFRPGTLDKLGVSYEIMKKHNPRIILASISGFGQSGQYSRKPGYDVLAQAMGGLMSVTGEKNSTPVKAGYSMADLGTGMWAAFGILASLWDREKTNKGQWIDLALLDTIVSWQTYLAGNYFATGENPGPLGTEHPNIVPYQVFEASNGSFVVAIANDKLWSAFLEKINMDVLKNEKYKRNHDRVKHRDILIPILEDIFRQRTREEWNEFFDSIKIPFGPVNNLSEILQDDHVFERGMVQEMQNNEEVSFKSLSIPIQFSKKVKINKSFPPKLGEHTEEIMEKLGFESNEIDNCINEEIVRRAEKDKNKP